MRNSGSASVHHLCLDVTSGGLEEQVALGPQGSPTTSSVLTAPPGELFRSGKTVKFEKGREKKSSSS